MRAALVTLAACALLQSLTSCAQPPRSVDAMVCITYSIGTNEQGQNVIALLCERSEALASAPLVVE